MIIEPNKTAKLDGAYTVTHKCLHQENRVVSYKSRFSANGKRVAW